jgi:hypothetical protein
VKQRCLVGTALLLLAGACARPPAPVPAPKTVQAVAVFPPDNLTGDALLVEGGTVLEKYVFHTERVTVGDVLAAEARMQLASRGVAVVPPDVVDAAAGDPPPLGAHGAAAAAARSHIGAAVLFIEIRRWQPDAPFQPRSIIVSLAATLVDPSDQRTLWTAERPSRPIATPGAVTPGAADVIAAAKAIEELLAPLSSLRAPPAEPSPGQL